MSSKRTARGPIDQPDPVGVVPGRTEQVRRPGEQGPCALPLGPLHGRLQQGSTVRAHRDPTRALEVDGDRAQAERAGPERTVGATLDLPGDGDQSTVAQGEGIRPRIGLCRVVMGADVDVEDRGRVLTGDRGVVDPDPEATYRRILAQSTGAPDAPLPPLAAAPDTTATQQPDTPTP